MSTSETLPTTYRGYTIRKETDPWRRQRGELIVFFKDNEEKCFYELSVTDAKITIDDMENEEPGPWRRKHLPPSSPLSISGDAAPLNILLFAMYDYDKKVNKIRIEAPGLNLEQHYKHIKEVMAVVAQALKDAEFERTLGETKD